MMLSVLSYIWSHWLSPRNSPVVLQILTTSLTAYSCFIPPSPSLLLSYPLLSLHKHSILHLIANGLSNQISSLHCFIVASVPHGSLEHNMLTDAINSIFAAQWKDDWFCPSSKNEISGDDAPRAPINILPQCTSDSTSPLRHAGF